MVLMRLVRPKMFILILQTQLLWVLTYLGVIVLLQVGMLKSFLHCRSFVRIEGQHLLKQIDSLGVRVGVNPVEGNLGLVGERSKVAAGLG